MSARRPTALGSALRGALAGAAGTAAMTGWQTLAAKLRSSGSEQAGPSEQPEDPWEQAPAPAKVAKRIAGDVFHQDLSADLIPLLSNVMHWAYGTGWGVLYGVAAAGRSGRALRRGAVFGSLVWASSYAELVPLGIYEPPWEYEPQELAMDLSYHLVYGVGSAVALRALTG